MRESNLFQFGAVNAASGIAKFPEQREREDIGGHARGPGDVELGFANVHFGVELRAGISGEPVLRADAGARSRKEIRGDRMSGDERGDVFEELARAADEIFVAQKRVAGRLRAQEPAKGIVSEPEGEACPESAGAIVAIGAAPTVHNAVRMPDEMHDVNFYAGNLAEQITGGNIFRGIDDDGAARTSEKRFVSARDGGSERLEGREAPANFEMPPEAGEITRPEKARAELRGFGRNAGDDVAPEVAIGGEFAARAAERGRFGVAIEEVGSFGDVEEAGNFAEKLGEESRAGADGARDVEDLDFAFAGDCG